MKKKLTCFYFFRSAISANALYLEAEAREGSERLAKNIPGGPEIIGAVYIHPSAHVDPTAKVNLNDRVACNQIYILTLYIFRLDLMYPLDLVLILWAVFV